MSSDNKFLTTAVIHPLVEHSNFQRNCEHLLELNRGASQGGAKIIVNTEMGLSGYSFQSRDELIHMTINEESEIYQNFASLAGEFQNYICLGAAYRAPGSRIIYNSAIVFGPRGEAELLYNKINGEYRWACCGDANQDNTFETPWGRVGVLICSDSYFALLARATALRGARMFLIPANWPNMGLNPLEVWKGRAAENGVPILVANRAGFDRKMSFEEAFSAFIDHRGQDIICKNSMEPEIHYARVELCDNLIVHDHSVFENRNPDKYCNIYLNLRSLASVQEHFELPESGEVRVLALSFLPREDDLGMIKENIKSGEGKPILLFPRGEHEVSVIEKISRELSAVAVFQDISSGEAGWHVFDSGEKVNIPSREKELLLDSAKVALVEGRELFEPERFYHFAKSGCDLILVSGDDRFDNIELLSGIRAIENTAVAVAFRGYASLATPPTSHNRWKQESVHQGRGCASYIINTEDLRKKRLHHDYDYETLLK